MIRKTVYHVFILSLFVGLVALPAWGLDLQPGEYEITSKVEMPGMPMQMPPQTTTQCLTEKDPVPNQSVQNQGCKIKDMKTKGNTVTWKMVCDQDGTKTESSGSMTYHGDHFEGTFQTKMGPEMGNTIVSTVITGKRIGKCR